MFYKLLSRVASKNFTTYLFVIGAILTALFTLFFLLGLKINPFYFFIPISLWTLLFFINLISCLIVDRYRDIGNYMCHLALFLIFAGIIISFNTRFIGVAKIYEGMVFFGDESDYTIHNREGKFDAYAPDVDFILQSIEVNYWDKMFLFTKMNGNIVYPPILKDKEGVITLNSSPVISDARMVIKDFGYYPNLEVIIDNEKVNDGVLPLQVYPYGHGDKIEVDQYRINVDVLPDPILENGIYLNKSNYVREPLLEMKIHWLDKLVEVKYLKKGEKVQVGKMNFKFQGLNKWIDVRIVKDMGEIFVFLGFILFAIGLIFRYLPEARKRF